MSAALDFSPFRTLTRLRFVADALWRVDFSYEHSFGSVSELDPAARDQAIADIFGGAYPDPNHPYDYGWALKFDGDYNGDEVMEYRAELMNRYVRDVHVSEAHDWTPPAPSDNGAWMPYFPSSYHAFMADGAGVEHFALGFLPYRFIITSATRLA